jgi:hypothetical protein
MSTTCQFDFSHCSLLIIRSDECSGKYTTSGFQSREHEFKVRSRDIHKGAPFGWRLSLRC